MSNGNEPVIAQEKATARHALAASIIGTTFIVVLLLVAVYQPTPSGFQADIFTVVLALAAAGFAAILPGTISTNIPKGINAAGALAVFIIVFFFLPSKSARPTPTVPATVPVKGEAEAKNGSILVYIAFGPSIVEKEKTDFSIDVPYSADGKEYHALFITGESLISHQSLKPNKPGEDVHVKKKVELQ